MKPAIIVQKYGGTSVGSPSRIKGVAQHIARTVASGHKVLVVVSAMGEQTDELIALAREFSADPPRRELDMLLTTGERTTMALLSIALHELKIPAISLTGSQSGILTDETHGNARIEKILGDRIRDGFTKSDVVIVAGFQGVSPRTREITTLGRGGSDLSAIALAAALGAEKCELYKDVDAVMTTDPRLVPSARPIAKLPWDAMCELAWAGASVLHSRGAHVALRYQIPLVIRSSFNVDRPGTVVSGSRELGTLSGGNMESVMVYAIAQKAKMSLLRLSSSADVAQNALSRSLSWLWSVGETPVVNQSSSTGSGRELIQVLSTANAHKVAAELKQSGVRIQLTDGLASVTVIGSGFWQAPEVVAEIEKIAGSSCLMEVRNSSVVLCLPESDMPRVAAEIHRKFVEVPA